MFCFLFVLGEPDSHFHGSPGLKAGNVGNQRNLRLLALLERKVLGFTRFKAEKPAYRTLLAQRPGTQAFAAAQNGFDASFGTSCHGLAY